MDKRHVGQLLCLTDSFLLNYTAESGYPSTLTGIKKPAKVKTRGKSGVYDKHKKQKCLIKNARRKNKWLCMKLRV